MLHLKVPTVTPMSIGCNRCGLEYIFFDAHRRIRYRYSTFDDNQTRSKVVSNFFPAWINDWQSMKGIG